MKSEHVFLKEQLAKIKEEANKAVEVEWCKDKQITKLASAINELANVCEKIVGMLP